MPGPSEKLVALAAVVAAFASGCPKPPPEAPPPPPVAEAPPPPPPKKCEALSEKCESKADTRAKIANSDLTFAPATGWLYAQQASSTIAQTADGGPVVAFIGIDADAKDAKKESAARDAALAALVKELEIAPLKRKVSWKKPDDVKEIGGLKVGRWQLSEPGVRGVKKGQLLVVAAPSGEGKEVVGLGFVPDDDKTSADVAIMNSIESLGKAR